MAATHNQFFLVGIAFTPDAASAGFVSRFTDQNDTEAGANIHLDWIQTLVTQPAEYFVDKPSIAAGPNGHVYVAYVVFDETDPKRLNSKIYVYRSADYGETWSTGVVVSDPRTRNQSPWIMVDPNNESTVYIGWRVFSPSINASAPNAIVGRVSMDGGASFLPRVPYTVAKQLKAFDAPQGTLPQAPPSPRSKAYPSAVIDGNGAIHVAVQEYVDPASGVPLSPGQPVRPGCRALR